MMVLFRTRALAAAALLVMLMLLQVLLGDGYSVVVGALLIASVTVQWAATRFFAVRSRLEPSIYSLRIRAQDAFTLAMASSVAGFLGILLVFRVLNWIPPVPREVFLVGISFALLLIVGPAINWLWIWRPWEPDPAHEPRSQ